MGLKKDWAAGEEMLAADLNDNFDQLQDASGIIDTLLAGETIDGETLPVPIMVAESNEDEEQKIANVGTTVGWNVRGAYWYGQTFTTDSDTNYLTKVLLSLQKVGSPSGNINVSIYATSGGLPTGAALATKSISASAVNSSMSSHEFEFASPVSVSPSTVYAIVVSVPSGDGGNNVQWGYAGSDSYAGGNRVESSNSGSSWSAQTYDAGFEVYGYVDPFGTSGRIYACDADNTDRLSFLGFAISAADAGNAIELRCEGIVGGFTGLKIGNLYYVQDAVGTIGISPGSNEIIVGRAVSSTQLLILHA